jgi:hypothetical protein
MSEGFVSSVLINTPAGDKEIGKLKIGDRVWGFDPETGDPTLQTVVATQTTEEKYRLREQDCGKKQRFWHGQRFESAEKLFEEVPKFEDHLVIITTEPHHTFITAEGWWCHNGGGSSPAPGSQAVSGKSKSDSEQHGINQGYNLNYGINTGIGGGTSYGQQDSVRNPWELTTPYWQQMLSAAGNELAAGPRTLSQFEGELYAAPNADQLEAIKRLRGKAMAGESIGGTAGTPDGVGKAELEQFALDLLNGKWLTAESNPYLQSAIDAANRQTQKSFLRDVAPAISSQAQLQGAYGGSRHGVAQAIAADDNLQRQADVASMMSLQNLENEKARQMQAGGLLQQAMAMRGRPGSPGESAESVLMRIGDWQQRQDQAALEAGAQKWGMNSPIEQYNAQAPWNNIQNMAGVLTGANAFGSQSGTSQQDQSNWSLGNNIGIGGSYGISDQYGSQNQVYDNMQNVQGKSPTGNFLSGALGGLAAGGAAGVAAPWLALPALGGGLLGMFG